MDLHGQHEHQSLLSAAAQRVALDAFAGTDITELESVRFDVKRIRAALEELGGDERSRQREMDLLRFQIDEIDAASIDDPLEDESLSAHEDVLVGVVSHRESADSAIDAISGEMGALDRIGEAIHATRDGKPFEELAIRLRGLQAELSDAVTSLRDQAESFREDPERLQAIRERRQLLRDLQRKYGEGLNEVMSFADGLRDELRVLESHDEEVARLERDLSDARSRTSEVEKRVGEARRAAAPKMGDAVTERLADLAMAGAVVKVNVGDGAGDAVEMRLAANSGQAPAPLAKPPLEVSFPGRCLLRA